MPEPLVRDPPPAMTRRPSLRGRDGGGGDWQRPQLPGAARAPAGFRYRSGRVSSAGVEFVCPSVTSDGFKEVLGSAAAATATTGAFQAANPWVRYQGIGHGFAVLDVTPERVQTDFFSIRSGDGDKGLAVHPRTDPAATVGYETSYASTRGSRQISGPVPQLGPRSDSPRAAGGRRGRPRRR